MAAYYSSNRLVKQKISALRSENLEALVFNGSKTRSASGLAEVSLTFENTVICAYRI